MAYRQQHGYQQNVWQRAPVANNNAYRRWYIVFFVVTVTMIFVHDVVTKISSEKRKAYQSSSIC